MKEIILKRIGSAVLFTFLLNSVFAQLNVTNTLMGSASFSAERSKISIANSFGETFIFSNASGSVYYNQGFHNSELNTLVSVTDLPQNSINVQIYPNPVQNDLFIRSETAFATLKIYSVEGKLTKKTTLKRNEVLNVSELQTGLYIIQLITDQNTTYSGKFYKI